MKPPSVQNRDEKATRERVGGAGEIESLFVQLWVISIILMSSSRSVIYKSPESSKQVL